MHMSIRTAAATAITATCALALSGAAHAQAGSSSDRHQTLIVINGPSVFMDLNEPGFGAGDQFTFFNVITRDGHPVGHEGGSCTVVEFTNDQSPVSFSCTSTLDLLEGQITVQLLNRDTGTNAPFYGSITGGSRQYGSWNLTGQRAVPGRARRA